ncbi:MAG: GNAT family N-acetyltransferase [Flavobacteriales bacterium]|nr:GNAT family N-acetyltransferase [Flavobacteriales bacterium]
MEIRIKKVETQAEKEQIFSIRNEVFVVEQKVDPALEYDEFEDSSTHFIAQINNEAVGTARWRKTPNGIKLERFAVLKKSRNLGVGSKLVEAVLADLPTEEYVYLHAQLTAMNLYARHGFQAIEPQFEEAGIQHYKMILKQ